MNSITKTTTTMMPVSGRIPEDLYQWLSSTPLDGASTISDKLRVAVSTLKRLQDGDADYNGALAMHRDLTHKTRSQLSELEPTYGHSEVLASLMEHIPALAATLNSAQIKDLQGAVQLEAQLTARSLQLAESLLRQAITSQARAHDGKVVLKHIQPLVELALIIQHNASK